MDYLEAEVPYTEDGEYQYATMSAKYSRSGEGKSTRTTIEFKDAHGWYGGDVTFTELGGETHGPYFTDNFKITLNGEFEADDFIMFCRQIVKHHDMHKKLMGTG